ncbi:MAG: hypothetical protein AAB343_00500 [Patescibacteria group bacterium]
MNSSRKKILIIISFVIILSGMSTLFWYFNRQEGGVAPEGNLPDSEGRVDSPGVSAGPVGTIITEGEEATAEIAQNVISGVFAPNSATVRYIERASGLVYEKPITGGTAIALSDKRLDNAYIADWAGNGSAALLTFSTDGVKPNFAHVAFTSSSSVVTVLPAETLFAAISPDGARVAFAKTSTDGSIIASALPNGTKPITLAPHPQTQLLMSWDVSARPVVRNPGSAFAESLAWMVGGGTYTPIVPASYQLSLLERPSGQYILYSAAEKSTDAPSLYLIDTKTKTTTERLMTAPFATYPEKCAWARVNMSVVYCAVPTNIPKQSYDAWLRGEQHFTDRILQWDILTGEVKTIVEGNFDAIELAIAPDDSALLFVNKNDSSLWGHMLK